jgi:hypothetical protein
MPAAGKVTVKKTRTEIVLSDGNGHSYSLPRSTGRPLLLDIDPRIDLTKPIYEQMQEIDAKDTAAATKIKKRKRHARAA